MAPPAKTVRRRARVRPRADLIGKRSLPERHGARKGVEPSMSDDNLSSLVNMTMAAVEKGVSGESDSSGMALLADLQFRLSRGSNTRDDRINTLKDFWFKKAEAQSAAGKSIKPMRLILKRLSVVSSGHFTDSSTPPPRRPGDHSIMCSNCGGHDILHDYCSGDAICTNCAVVVHIPMSHNPVRVPFEDIPGKNLQEKTVYERPRYLDKLLNNYQSSCEPLPKIATDFIHLMRGCKFTSWSALRESMYVHGLARLYPRMYHIGEILYPDIRLPWLTSGQVKVICGDFSLIEYTFKLMTAEEKQGHTSMPNYQFVIRQICIYRGFHHITPLILLPTCKQSERVRLLIWGVIARKLGWQ